MTSPNQSAMVMLKSLLQQWGLESLTSVVQDMLTAGDSADVIPIKLRETEAYKTRFKANLDRVAKGLPAMSEAEFLATEAQLKTVVRRFVGSGTYDTQDNLNKWIAGDLSPQELNDRMTMYRDAYLQKPQAVKDAWAAEGFTPGDAIVAIMDPSVDETTLRKRSSIYALGAEAFQAYGDRSAFNVQRLSDLVDQGVDEQDARRAFQDVAGREENEDRLARRSGTTLSRAEQEDAALGDVQAERKRRQVLTTETSRFEENYLGTQGSLGNVSAGRY